jgi:hypothetical protein
MQIAHLVYCGGGKSKRCAKDEGKRSVKEERYKINPVAWYVLRVPRKRKTQTYTKSKRSAINIQPSGRVMSRLCDSLDGVFLRQHAVLKRLQAES